MMDQVKNGLYAAMKRGGVVRSVFIDEELLELQRMNDRAKANRARREQTESARASRAAAQRRRTAKVRRRGHRDIRTIVSQELKLLGMAGAVFLGQQMGFVDWEWAAPVLIGIQTVICFRAGRFVGGRRSRG